MAGSERVEAVLAPADFIICRRRCPATSGHFCNHSAKSTVKKARLSRSDFRSMGRFAKMSRLPISTKRPNGLSISTLWINASPASELSTRSTPAGATLRTPSVNDKSRLSKTASAPNSATTDCLSTLAVARTRAPSQRAICTAAWPTPPAAAWIKAVSPRCSRPHSISPYQAVRKAIGTPAPNSGLSATGRGATSRASASTSVAMQLGAMATTGSPTLKP